MLTGLFIVPFAKLFKNQSMTVTFVIMGAGCACMMLAQNVVPVCIAAVCMAMSNALFTVRMNQTVTDVSAAMGMSFNIAFVSCVCNLGQALSPLIMSGVFRHFRRLHLREVRHRRCAYGGVRSCRLHAVSQRSVIYRIEAYPGAV